jgi:Mrp family chromosome partitioning ATPase
MGRVFDAIRKSSANGDNNGKAPKRQSSENERRQEVPRVSSPLPSARDIEEQLFAGSSIMTVSGETAPGSASSAHTTDVPDGSALPGGIASRDAGATLDAAGATRAGGFVSYDISPARVEPHLVAVSQPRSAYCEQFRALRTRILQAGERTQMRAMVVTSTGVAEGKTLTALNLGWLLAQTEGIRALVIDSDLRRPCATDYFGIDAREGLSEVLGGRLRLEDAIVRLDPAGMYYYIIIDAPPLGIFTDANVLMSRADGAMLVVRAGKTRYSHVDKLLDQIPREKVLGVVLNRAEEQPDSTNYYYQYRYSKREPLDGSKKKALAEERPAAEVAVLN